LGGGEEKMGKGATELHDMGGITYLWASGPGTEANFRQISVGNNVRIIGPRRFQAGKYPRSLPKYYFPGNGSFLGERSHAPFSHCVPRSARWISRQAYYELNVKYFSWRLQLDHLCWIE